VILVFIIWFGGWGWGPYGGWWGWSGANRAAVRPGPIGTTGNGNYAAKNGQNTTPAPAGNNLNQTTDTLAVLTSPAKQSYLGKKVELKNVRVQGTSGNAIWVGSSDSQKLLVVEQKRNQHAAPPAQNSEIDVRGTVEKAPPAQQAEKQWGLSGNDAQQVEKDGVYIAANQVQPLQPR
jgi:hypothetical protein